MITIILIKKNGDLEEKNVKKIDEDTIYKICNYKTDKDFHKLHQYSYEKSNIIVYGKINGKANYENKYEFPPPIDTNLYFGTLCLIKQKKDGSYYNLNIEEWEKIYESLFGGFDDICDSDDEVRSMDSEVYEDEEYTEEGYLKDGFIVDDDELMEEEYLSYESDN